MMPNSITPPEVIEGLEGATNQLEIQAALHGIARDGLAKYGIV